MQVAQRPPKRVVFLNGPPKVGKDTVASHLVPYLQFESMKMAAPLKRMAAALLNMDVSAVERHKDAEFNILCRESSRQDPNFNHTIYEYGEKDTLRRLLIRLSEEFLKPVYGNTFFGRIAARELQRSSNSLIIFTDSGFLEEIDPIIRTVGKSNTILIRLHRDGCIYAGDSRSYLPDNIAGDSRDIDNNGALTFTVGKCAAAIRNYFKLELMKEFEL